MAEAPKTDTAGLEAQVRTWLEDVADPEIPVLSVVDLGIVRAVRAVPDGVEIDVTPTYSACPATEFIERRIVDTLRARGFGRVVLRRVLAPAWTTDWISESGRDKLRQYGIAPPSAAPDVACPRCGSPDTALVSRYGSTPCKAAYRCAACLEPFEHFKCL